MNTRIIIDSTTDIPKAFIQEYDILTLPLHIHVDGVEHIDGVTIHTNELYEKMKAGSIPKTSQVSIVDTRDTIEECLSQGEDVLYLAFSSHMSGTCSLVHSIMEALGEKYPGRKLCTLDSMGGSFATGLIAMRTAQKADALPFDELVTYSQFLIDHVEHLFTIDDLSWMIRGGRVSKTLGYTANLLNIKPVLDVQDGEMEVIHKIRGRKNAMKKVADLVAERASGCRRQTIGITHADDIDAANEMKELLKQRLPECDFLIEEIGAVLGVYMGIGGVGVFFFNALPPSETN